MHQRNWFFEALLRRITTETQRCTEKQSSKRLFERKRVSEQAELKSLPSGSYEPAELEVLEPVELKT
jgi:hypothetical protein